MAFVCGTVSAICWAVVDTVHSYTGLPPLNFSRLGKNVAAYGRLIDIHYRHYQFYGSMFLACAIAYTGYRVKLGGMLPLGWLDIAFVVLEVVFFITSRDCGNTTPAASNCWRVTSDRTRVEQSLGTGIQPPLTMEIRRRVPERPESRGSSSINFASQRPCYFGCFECLPRMPCSTLGRPPLPSSISIRYLLRCSVV